MLEEDLFESDDFISSSCEEDAYDKPINNDADESSKNDSQPTKISTYGKREKSYKVVLV